MLPSFPLLLAASTADSTALTNSTVATTILAGSGLATMAATTLQVGSTIKILMRGRISTLATTPGTLTLDVRLNGVVISALGALSLNISAQTNASWEAEFLVSIRALGTGTSANALVTMRFTSRALLGSVAVASGGDMVILMPDTGPAVGPGFDSTSAMPINVFGTWSTASASNSILTHQSFIELKV